MGLFVGVNVMGAHLCVAHFQKRSANSIAGRFGAAVATATTTIVCG